MNRPGLRERKKIETLHRLQEEALRLFDEQGYDATTIEQIAAAAGVSASTFYRYSPTKEDVVVQDEYDPLIVNVFESRTDDAPLEALRSVLAVLFAEFTEADIARVRRRVRMIFTVPALRARQVQQTTATEELLARMVAERTGRSPGELEVRHFTALVVTSWTVAISAWAATEGTKDDLLATMDRCLTHLEAGAPLLGAAPHECHVNLVAWQLTRSQRRGRSSATSSAAPPRTSTPSSPTTIDLLPSS